jgi:oligoendopeptidase F
MLMTSKKLDNLPRWDFTNLYSGPQDPKINQELTDIEARAISFAARYQDKLADIGSADFGSAIEELDNLWDDLGLIIGYSYLLHSTNLEDPIVSQFFQTIQEKYTVISTKMLFFTLEINRLSEENLADKLENPKVAKYAPWLRDINVQKPYQLSDELEKFVHEKDLSSRMAWIRLFDETMASLRFPFEGKDITSAEIFNFLVDKDSKRREQAAQSVAGVLKKNLRVFGLITNTLAKDKETIDQWRGYKQPISSRNLANFVEDDVVDSLISTVKSSYPDLSHRYYRLKAKWMGAKTIPYWDRNAPIGGNDARFFSWDEAKDTVLDAYGAFSPELAKIGQRFFDEGWIDADVRQGKDSGAYAHPMVPKYHPYILLNFQGKTRDVMTLAHELGHGVHQVLAAEQGALMSDTPLTLAETASVFGEMLTFRSLLKKIDNEEERRVLLASKTEDMLNTVVRQIAFCEFERVLHDSRRQGELTIDQIGEVWMKAQQDSLGDAIDLDPEYAVFWSYIPHFIHSPFYVYAYAFGDCLVNSLYATYEAQPDGFEAKYLDMLRAGGTKWHKELLAPFGLDARDPAFWKKGLSMVSGFIDELETMDS